MLRPATPLSILFFAAFVLLLLSTLSTPIIKAIPLGTVRGINLGVFGYCNDKGCEGPKIGYDTDKLFGDGKNSDLDFSLPSATRHQLSTILIVHPVAALLTLICFSLAIAAHFHSPAHSPRYLLALLILTFPTLLVSLLAFLVDVLIFVPHMAWGGWIVLAATILIVASGVVTCAMRRTLVSRKARKRRIAENSEMNGENYYAARTETTADLLPKAESPPPLSGDTVTPGQDKMPEFAVFESRKQQDQDELTPLNARNPSLKTTSSDGRGTSERSYPSRGPSGRGRTPVDQYGNPIPPMPNDGYTMQNIPMRQGPPPRGGMNSRGRGGYPPRGAPRGGYGPPRGGPRGGQQGMVRGPPPPGWNGGRGGYGPGPGQAGRGQRGPPPGYDNGYYGQGPPPRAPGPYGPREVSPPPGLHPPMPVGQALEMQDRSGTPPQNQNYGLRDSDDDVQGMLALQQGGFAGPPPPQPSRSKPMSPVNGLGQEQVLSSLVSRKKNLTTIREYGPAKVNWNQNGNSVSDQTVPTVSNGGSGSRRLSPIQDSPVELPTHSSTIGLPNNAPTSSGDYYEDVDPQFAEPIQPVAHPAPLPASLVPGGGNADPNFLSAVPANVSNPSLNNSDDTPEGSRSPAASEASHFTSVSQRGVNPNWRPPPPGMGGPPLPGQYAPYGGARRPMRQEDVILEANADNPDFALPGAGPVGRSHRRGLSGSRSGRGGGSMRAPGMIPSMGGNRGPYPGNNAI
ncbi:pali-domain-containing protein [Delitschia confertaspora ATCC 74209]|uniref:Pali-domain-containing protein n=1 Tax=Delitschia confertaspora ATCC 74209 TaxID=1513339 RepID=A0A9P4JTY0_9PLEO|nr:pali-domain-containing protein [Delitschia confertaspora ATCC 74209]